MQKNKIPSIIKFLLLISLIIPSLIIVLFACTKFEALRNKTLAPHELITPIILNLKGASLLDENKELYQNANPFGFILFGYNITSYDQTKTLIHDLRALYPNRKLYIAIDQEGGRVDRLKNIVEEKDKLLKKAIYYGELAKTDLTKAKKEIYQDSKYTAHILKDLGFDINFAPMVDLIHTNANNSSSEDKTWSATEDRSYSSDPKIVISLAREFIRGMHDEGILVTLKHMPGLGRSYTDSHDTSAIIPATLQTLKDSDFMPFNELSDISDFAMVSHASYLDIDNNPASISKKMINIIRQDMKFNNLLISDALNMKALEDYTLEEKIEKSLNAGIDIVIPNHLSLQVVVKSVRAIDDDIITRFNKKLSNLKTNNN